MAQQPDKPALKHPENDNGGNDSNNNKKSNERHIDWDQQTNEDDANHQEPPKEFKEHRKEHYHSEFGLVQKFRQEHPEELEIADDDDKGNNGNDHSNNKSGEGDA